MKTALATVNRGTPLKSVNHASYGVSALYLVRKALARGIVLCMPFVHEIQIKSEGFPGAPGFTNLYFAAEVLGPFEDQFVSAKALLDAIAAWQPTQWSGQIQPSGRVLESTTGVLADFSTAPVPQQAEVQGQLSAVYGPGVAGYVIGWNTTTIRNGRVIRGRTFVVPTAGGIWDAEGTLQTSTLNAVRAAADALVADAVGFSVWSRPVGGLGGVVAPVTSARVNDRSAFLSSRRS